MYRLLYSYEGIVHAVGSVAVRVGRWAALETRLNFPTIVHSGHRWSVISISRHNLWRYLKSLNTLTCVSKFVDQDRTRFQDNINDYCCTSLATKRQTS